MFKLKAPCKDCPFRYDKENQQGWLGGARAKSIHDTLLDGKIFSCHKTVVSSDDYEDEHEDENYESPRMIQPGENFCAGALILLEKSGDAMKSQAIRMAERLRLYDRSKLNMDSPVFDSRESFIKWHTNSRG